MDLLLLRQLNLQQQHDYWLLYYRISNLILVARSTIVFQVFYSETHLVPDFVII